MYGSHWRVILAIKYGRMFLPLRGMPKRSRVT